MGTRYLKPTLGSKRGNIQWLQCCILKLALHSVNSVLILYKTGSMQSAILLLFVVSLPRPYCHVGFNLLTRQCPVIFVHTNYITSTGRKQWNDLRITPKSVFKLMEIILNKKMCSLGFRIIWSVFWRVVSKFMRHRVWVTGQ